MPIFVNYYFGLFIILIYILKYFKKYRISLVLFLLYILSLGFFIDINSIYENWKIVFFIILPHLIVLDDVLCHKYLLSEKMDFIMGVLFALSYLNANMYIFLVSAYLLMVIYDKLHIRGYIAIAVFITLSWLILHIYNLYVNTQQDCLFQTIIIIGIGMSCFFGFLFSDEDMKSSSG
jgi:hypothetical protein